MRTVERYIDLDPVAEWEGEFMLALEGVLKRVPEDESAEALEAFRALDVSLYSPAMVREVTRLRESSTEKLSDGAPISLGP